jgi:hypothetical protein
LDRVHQIFSRFHDVITFLLHSILPETDGVDVDEPDYTIVRALHDDERRVKVITVEEAEINKAIHG